jgi:hypothetical protein
MLGDTVDSEFKEASQRSFLIFSTRPGSYALYVGNITIKRGKEVKQGGWTQRVASGRKCKPRKNEEDFSRMSVRMFVNDAIFSLLLFEDISRTSKFRLC